MNIKELACYEENFKSGKIGKILQEQREKLGLSKYRLAKELNVNPQSIAFWEQGAAIPSADKFAMLCSILKF